MLSEIPLPFGLSLLGRQGISTFSICLMIAVICLAFISPREMKRRGLDPTVSDLFIFWTFIGGFIGSKLFFIFEIWSRIWIVDISFWDTFYRVFFTWSGMRHAGGESLWGYLFSGGGLVFYGGLIVTVTCLYIHLGVKKLSRLKYGDAYIMVLSLGYAVGRLGCFFSGDGCFGHASSINLPLLTWVYGPADGNCPNDPALSWAYPYMCTSGIRVWNTPVIEALFSSAFFLFCMLWLRYQNCRPGIIMASAMIWNGFIRFCVEFIRLNDAVIPILDSPTYTQGTTKIMLKHHIEQQGGLHPASEYFSYWHWYGFTQAQIIGFFLIVAGLTWLFAAKLYKRDYKPTKIQ